MEVSNIILCVLSAMIIIFGLLSVTSRNIVRSAVYLLISLVNVGGIYFWLDFQFIAAVQIAVYVGGIIVLIIFSIFLTHQTGEKLQKPSLWRSLLSIFIVLISTITVLYELYKYDFIYFDSGHPNVEMENIGTKLLSIQNGGYALPFELVSVLLLAAMIGCIIIAPKQRKEIKK